MREIKNKKILPKLIIILLLLLLFQFVCSTPVHAVDGDILVEPITSLFANLGDGIMEIMQRTFLGIETSGAWVEIGNGNLWTKILIIAGTILIAVVAVIAVVYSAGTALAIFMTAAGAVVKIFTGGAIVYFATDLLRIGTDRNLFTGILFNTRNNF